MNRAAMGLIGLCMASGAMIVASPDANAAPLCEHRSAAHSAQHGGQDVDSAWHVAHGDRPTCDGDDQKHESRPNDEPDDSGPILPRRDNFGFHCTWHGCG